MRRRKKWWKAPENQTVAHRKCKPLKTKIYIIDFRVTFGRRLLRIPLNRCDIVVLQHFPTYFVSLVWRHSQCYFPPKCTVGSWHSQQMEAIGQVLRITVDGTRNLSKILGNLAKKTTEKRSKMTQKEEPISEYLETEQKNTRQPLDGWGLEWRIQTWLSADYCLQSTHICIHVDRYIMLVWCGNNDFPILGQSY